MWVGFVVDKVAMGQVHLKIIQSSPVSIIPPLIHMPSRIMWGMDKGTARWQQFHKDYISHRYHVNVILGGKLKIIQRGSLQ
jgi:hypothetical protein